jgi:hypothetical protein
MTVSPVLSRLGEFFSKPYLGPSSYTVEDITTAIQTGWKMLGETNMPNVSFHKDTKLLIAFGEEEKLKLIDDVLSQLKGHSSSAPTVWQQPITPQPSP